MTKTIIACFSITVMIIMAINFFDDDRGYETKVSESLGWRDVEFRNITTHGDRTCGQHSVKNAYGEIVNWLNFVAVGPSETDSWRVYLSKDWPIGLDQKCPVT